MNVCLISRCRRTCINRMALFGILFALYGTALAYHLGDYGAEAIWGGILAVVFFVWGLPALRCLVDIARHQAVKRAALWGDPMSLSIEMENEYQNPQMKKRKTRLSNRYIFRAGYFNFDVIRIADIVWAYKKVMKKRLNFIIPMGKDYEAIFVALGGNMECMGPQKFVDESLEFVAARNPGALYGYTEELARLFQQDPGGFAEMVRKARSD